ncbi:MAG: type II secretion system protein [Candidatus Eremiobacteraeota bacterium]|nr:type II secretion system protein [Candidatus Eremiobacteraeota bacterium]MCW5867534.1 type II secretion system protein [Candidatus Eremiobacteraeota bacterium]
MRRGWSLPEVMLVSALMAVVLLIVTSTLASTSRWTRQESQRGFAMGQLQSVLAHVESLLQRSCRAGVAYQPPAHGASGVLAMHLQDPAPYVSTPLWEAHWTCLSWNPERRQVHHFPSPVPARTQLPLLPSPAQLDQMAAGAGRRNLLASDVTDFDYALLVGPVAQIRLELEINAGRTQPEKIQLSRKIYFRNRI